MQAQLYVLMYHDKCRSCLLKKLIIVVDIVIALRMESSVPTVTVRTVLTIWNMKKRGRKQSNNVWTEIHKHSILK